MYSTAFKTSAKLCENHTKKCMFVDDDNLDISVWLGK